MSVMAPLWHQTAVFRRFFVHELQAQQAAVVTCLNTVLR